MCRPFVRKVRFSQRVFPRFYGLNNMSVLKSIQNAKPRPKAVAYGDVTLAIQDAAYAAIQGQKDPQTALNDLQTKLQTLIK